MFTLEATWSQNPENNDLLKKASGRVEWSTRAGQTLQQELNQKQSLDSLSPEDQAQAKETKDQLDGLMLKGDIVSINEILRNPAKKRLLSPADLRKAFQMLRSIHMEETKQHIDTANVGAMRDDVTNRLDTVSAGYHEIFKNLQGHIESTGTIHEESGVNLIDLQNDVTQAEASIKSLLQKINTLGNTPAPLASWIQDMSPETVMDSGDLSNNF